MASRDVLASIHAYSGGVTFPFSGTWAQADLQHIAGMYRGLLSSDVTVTDWIILYAPARSFILDAVARSLDLNAPTRSLVIDAKVRD